MEYATLEEACAARQKELDPKGKLKSANWLFAELFREAGELANVIKKLERERLGIAGSRATKQQLADECADVIICLVNIYSELDIYRFVPHWIWAQTGQTGRSEAFGFSLNDVKTLATETRFLIGSVGWGEQSVHVSRIAHLVNEIASSAGVDLRAATKRKFNETSEKVGLATRWEDAP